MDAARGVALVAMMAVHVLPGTDADGAVTITDTIVRGRASAAFAVLAGVALSLAYARGAPLRSVAWVGAGAGLTVRCVLIGVLGLILGELDSGVAVILTYYAVLFILAVPLLALRAPALTAIAAPFCLLAPVASQLLRTNMAPKRGPSPAVSDLAEPGTLAAEVALTGYYPVLVWTTYLCLGLAVGRLRLTSDRVAAGLAGVGAVLAFGSALISQWLVGRGVGSGLLPSNADEVSFSGTVPTDTWWWLAVDSPHSGTPLDLAHTSGTALLLLGALLLVAGLASRLLLPLTRVGSMTLTLYSAHVVALAQGYGPDDPEQLYVLHVAVTVAVAMAWRSWHARGPLEQLVSWPSRATSRVVSGQRIG